jgi:dihydroorotase/N-acyl-D-amino-acid deacylase
MHMKKRTVLRGGLVVDGTGAAPFAATVVIEKARIAAIQKEGRRLPVGPVSQDDDIIDCSGLVIAPGFMDAHSHSDLQVVEGRKEKILQGVTTEVVGNCGFSAYPMPAQPQVLRDFANGILCGDDRWGWESSASYLDSARKTDVINVVSLVGHGSLRIKAAGNTCRALTAGELDSMASLLDEMLEQGASGLSSGLMYAPGSGASAEELVALCKVLARRGAIYTTHMRNYSAELVEAVEEQIDIASQAGCRLQISHLQAVAPENWPLQERAIAAIEAAVLRGVDVAFDSYPWVAGSTVLSQLLPQWCLDGGMPGLATRLADPQLREKIRVEVILENGTRWKDLFISSAVHEPGKVVGRSIHDIALERACDASDAVLDMLIEQQGNINILEYNQSMENLRALITHPLATVVSDGFYTRGRPHPRLHGTFPLLLGEMVRDRQWLSLPEAVHKISAKPASQFKVNHRGVLEQGYLADVTVFDPETVQSGATYDSPTTPPVGIRYVFRSGRVVLNHAATS